MTSWQCLACERINEHDFQFCPKCATGIEFGVNIEKKYIEKKIVNTKKKYINICNNCFYNYVEKDICSFQINCSYNICSNCDLSTQLIKIKTEQYNKGNYKVLNKEIINPTQLTICDVCNSEDITYESNQYQLGVTCNNCGTYNPNIRKINKINYNIGENTIKPRELVNSKQIEICSVCNNNKIIPIGDQRNPGIKCVNCETVDPNIIQIKESQFDKLEYKVKPKELVNPKKIDICGVCNYKKIIFTGDQRDLYAQCDNCKTINPNTLSIKESQFDKLEYKVKPKELVNPVKINICSICYSTKIKYVHSLDVHYNSICTNCGKIDPVVLIVNKRNVFHANS
jgi:hypothetical protein